MSYLFWGLLNIVLFIFFLIISIRLIKFIRIRIGLLVATIFVLGLLSIIGYANKGYYSKESNLNKRKSWNLIATEGNLNPKASFSMNIVLEKTLVSNFNLGIQYGKDSQSQVNIPISAYSSKTGFVSGVSWESTSIIVNRSDDNNTFKYFVAGIVKWKLIGATIYTQSKEFQGIAFIKL